MSAPQRGSFSPVALDQAARFHRRTVRPPQRFPEVGSTSGRPSLHEIVFRRRSRGTVDLGDSLSATRGPTLRRGMVIGRRVKNGEALVGGSEGR